MVKKNRQQGFTLIELSMVLVVMGLILGMIFKGKSLLEQAKSRNLQAQIQKIQLSVETFRQLHGYWPGDGCSEANAENCSGEKDGILDQTAEQQAFWRFLVENQLLGEQDRQHAFGKTWQIVSVEGRNQVMSNQLHTSLPSSHVCFLDRQMDDGQAKAGMIQAGQAYDMQTDCHTLEGETTLSVTL